MSSGRLVTMGIQRFMASQLRQPSGWFGSFVMSRLLNKVNGRIVAATLEQLNVKPEHDVLEIGFGGGSALELLLRTSTTGLVTGVDISAEMIRGAEHRFRQEIEKGRLRVQLGEATQLSFADAAFDRVFTINTIYFWPDTIKGLCEIYRVLRPQGLAAISIRSKEKMEKRSVTKHDFHLFSAEDLAGLMKEAGFRDVRIDHRDREKWYDQVVVVGSR